MADSKGGYLIVNFSISLLLTFGVNYHGPVVGENVAAIEYTVTLIKS